MGCWRKVIGVATTLSVLIVAACSANEGGDADGDGPGATATDVEPPAPIAELGPLSVAREGRPRIVDDQGRDVLLRGANLNALGDYHQDDPELSPTRSPTADDWDQMAANGFSVVRLIVSWSALEPERGELDRRYVDRIRDAVDDAAGPRHLHGHRLPPGRLRQVHRHAGRHRLPAGHRGGDRLGRRTRVGHPHRRRRAPAGRSGYREGAPAVQAAFRNFYENTDGIRDAFVATVGAGGGRVRGRADGRRLRPAERAQHGAAGRRVGPPGTPSWPAGLVTAIRAAEVDAGGFPHLLFLEPLVLFPLPGTMPDEGFADDRDIVFAPHNYAESIGPAILTVEQTADIDAGTAHDRGWPLWVGEYGVFETGDDKLDVLRRFAAAQDAQPVGWRGVAVAPALRRAAHRRHARQRRRRSRRAAQLRRLPRRPRRRAQRCRSSASWAGPTRGLRRAS